MSDIHLTISPDQRNLLVKLLTSAVKKKRVEVHRTEFSRDYRHELEAEESQLESLLEQLSNSTLAESPST
ncbi:MAG: hypothetical protein IT427_08385 [Pirellulales bacterium]|nr:hypothetical protein [Pirellulales bacterium]